MLDDPVANKSPNESVFEKDLIRLVEPYSYIELSYIASSMCMDQKVVEKKLAQMILDKKLHGILHQGEGMLIVYDREIPNPTYLNAVDTIQSMEGVVDELCALIKNIKK
ncbi:PCI domain-containing protein [Ditylenchus destructor]|uniref:PCI domain-containing protein n=1 Tax=Ditylenchus destructor TaxID=166010 RepID=A0AAD4NC93_9BILA|nr:PCI domain-containing protein [Ditylenchus destructor]